MFKPNFSVTTEFRVKCPPVATGLGRVTIKFEKHWSIIEQNSRFRTGYSNFRAKRSACECKNVVKQIYLLQYFAL